MFSVSRSSSSGTLSGLGSPVKAPVASSELSRSYTSPGAVSALTAAAATDRNPHQVDRANIPESDNAAAAAVVVAAEGATADTDTENEPINFRSYSPPPASHPQAASLPHPASMPSIRQPLTSHLGEFHFHSRFT